MEEAWQDADLLRAKGHAILAVGLDEARFSIKTGIDAIRAAFDLRAAIGAATEIDLVSAPGEVLEAIAGVGLDEEALEDEALPGEPDLDLGDPDTDDAAEGADDDVAEAPGSDEIEAIGPDDSPAMGPDDGLAGG